MHAKTLIFFVFFCFSINTVAFANFNVPDISNETHETFFGVNLKKKQFGCKANHIG